MIVYDYVGKESKEDDPPPKGAVRVWRDRLAVAQRAQLDQKLTMLSGAAVDLLPGLIAGPLSIKGKKYAHVYKLQIGGKVRLRPLLCKGPADPNRELTLLVGAFERGGELDPISAPQTAVERRQEVIDNVKLRKPYRFPEDEIDPPV